MAAIDTDASSESRAPSFPRPRSIRDAPVAGAHVLVSSDLDPVVHGVVADETKLLAALPTLQLLQLEGAASITVYANLGDRGSSLGPVEARLRELLPGAVTVAESAHFAARTDLVVEDAFAVVHRASPFAATGVPAYAGLLLEQELEHLGPLLGPVERPFVVVAGGASGEAKLRMLAQLGAHADSVLVGGRLADRLRVANPFPFPVELPVDVLGADSLVENARVDAMVVTSLPYGWLGLDIGPTTRRRFAEVIAGARTIFWVGALEAYGAPRSESGTKAIARAVADAHAYTVVAGDDASCALRDLSPDGHASWSCAGEESALLLLGGRDLPGLALIPTR